MSLRKENDMITERIRTEEPRREQWRLISQFIYPANIRAYIHQTHQNDANTHLISHIVGATRQAQAYFVAAESAPMDISPVLTYYGTTNLLSALVTLRTGAVPEIKGHGMELKIPQTNNKTQIADYEIMPRAGKTDGLAVYWRDLCPAANIPGGTSWTMKEIFASLPDLRINFQSCYATSRLYTIPVQVCHTPTIRFERIQRSSIVGYNAPMEALDLVRNFSKTYLKPQIDDGSQDIVLHNKLGAIDEGTYSIFGQKHLQIAHEKEHNMCYPDQAILMLMGLFAIGHLSRYYPSLWNPFVIGDETGEKLVIERFLYVCHRYLPNLVLNALYGKQFQFINDIESPQHLETELTEDDLLQMLRELKRKGKAF